MQKYFLRRLLLIPVTLFLISIIFFAMLRAIPGDTVDALFTDPGTNISEAGLLKLREDLGLTRPIYEQYGVWMWHLLRGDLGFSFHYGQPVSEVLKTRFPRTLEIMVLGITGSLLIGLPLGILSAYKQDSPLDNRRTGLRHKRSHLALLRLSRALSHLPSQGLQLDALGRGRGLRGVP